MTRTGQRAAGRFLLDKPISLTHTQVAVVDGMTTLMVEGNVVAWKDQRHLFMRLVNRSKMEVDRLNSLLAAKRLPLRVAVRNGVYVKLMNTLVNETFDVPERAVIEVAELPRLTVTILPGASGIRNASESQED